MLDSHPVLAKLIVSCVPIIMYLITRKIKLFKQKKYMLIPVFIVPMLVTAHFLLG